MSYSLNSLKGGSIGDYIGDYYKRIMGDTRSLDYSSYRILPGSILPFPAADQQVKQ